MFAPLNTAQCFRAAEVETTDGAEAPADDADAPEAETTGGPEDP